MIFREAVEDDIVPRSPCRNIKLPRMQKVERRFLSALEVERLAEAIEPPYGVLVRAAAYAGLRWEEAAALKWSNLSLDTGTLHVVAVIERDHGRYRFVEITKTEAESRAIRLPGFLLEDLRGTEKKSVKSYPRLLSGSLPPRKAGSCDTTISGIESGRARSKPLDLHRSDSMRYGTHRPPC